MRFLIDSADKNEINQALKIGFVGVTANPTMYKNNNLTLTDYLIENIAKTNWITAEVIGDSYQDMKEQVDNLYRVNPNIIIKLNYGIEELILARYIKSIGMKFAFTLIFTAPQAAIAMETGASYIFFFIARNEEIGNEPISILKTIKEMRNCSFKNCAIIGASIRNQKQLLEVCPLVDYAAINLKLVDSSFNLPATTLSAKKFSQDFE